MQTVIALFLWLLIPGADRRAVISTVLAEHPFHVSVTEINQNTAAQTLEVQCKFFTDDFELALKSTFNQKADLADGQLHERMDSLVSRYVRSHLQLRINDRAIEMGYLGFEQEREATYVYFEVANVAANIRNMDCSARLLYESFTDQVNIFHVTTAKGKKSTKLDYPATSVRLAFE
jgi:hypothetical protein